MKRIIPLFILCILLVPTAVYAKSATVTIPDFPVTVNGTKVDNSYDKYPFIIYNDITYFPMTYSGSRFLGLESEWKGNSGGLLIEKTGIAAAWKPYKSNTRNSGSYRATVPGFPIRINGKAVDNSSQKYPLLSFRNITYFPMTWEFGVNEFGWDYSFSNKDGLVINSDNIRLEQKKPATAVAKREYESTPGSATVTDQYIYYENQKGQIIQAKLADPSQMKTVYQLPVWSYGNGEYVYPNLYVENGTAYLKYHQGGAVMGSDWLLRLNDDGTTDELQNSYTRTKTFGDRSFSYFTGGAPGPGNLSMKIGDGEYKPLGSTDYLYGWAWTAQEDGSSGGSGSDDVYLVGDDLYILAFKDPLYSSADGMKPDATNGIYRVDINTGETVRVSDKEVLAFKMEGDFLYYHSDGTFYRQSIKDGKEEKIRQVVVPEPGKVTPNTFALEPKDIQNFLVLNGKIYWMKRSDQILYDIEGKNLNEGAVLDDMAIMGSSGEYLVCTFGETDTAKYRIMVFDRGGNVIFKTSDKAYCRNISIFGDRIYFYNLTTGTVCMGKMR
ncbi:DUF5050 domain-containing protein [Sinanaerobacter chloroacetimidivorans]|uniref:DUF5050 domain-containing protein n=1 Tax=Sinanaerobacter chloroacetimidivorans TaxID=2818044 RepID=A0A8J7W0K5_9FIRM|nr:DUF5050 domain-containing protein [Sinanaerobacter chloroacetimidivorans]MBR0597030.1 DUF5050 domain-containing protein [Sinanaerobacter chloroacetimidivorans]